MDGEGSILPEAFAETVRLFEERVAERDLVLRTDVPPEDHDIIQHSIETLGLSYEEVLAACILGRTRIMAQTGIDLVDLGSRYIVKTTKINNN